MTTDLFASGVVHEAARELANALARIRHCLDQLSDEQVWHRSQPSLNSVGNLVLHLEGNIRQWLVAGLGETPDGRNRPAEFSERGPIAKIELLRRLDAAVRDASAVLEKQTAADLLRPRRIQGFEVTGWRAIFDSVPHFRGHTQEIIGMTRAMLGDAYRFAWQPETPEEGAPS